MNILVSCPLCSRQYRANETRIGKKYYCRCGNVIVVPDPKTSHESRVVRCSSCGAPREGRDDHCSSCHSDFTIHEQDLNTVCPECLARISDTAKYCNQCGVEISAIPIATHSTSERCPVCEGKAMQQRHLSSDSVAFAECEGCAGLWLTSSTFDRVLKRARDQGLDTGIASLFPKTYVIDGHAMKEQRGPFYRKCPTCSEVMVRKLFPGTPVIIDLCSPHGIWFDAGELEKVLTLVRQGLKPDFSQTQVSRKSPPAARQPQRPITSPDETSFVHDLFDFLLSKVMG